VRKNRKVIIAILLTFFVSFPYTILAIDVDSSPGWLVFEKGKQLFDSEEYGDALYHFRKALATFGSSPEIEYWIGRVFEAGGEYILAERQYEAALEEQRLLLVPDDVLSIRYRLAKVHFAGGDFAGYSGQLEAIIAHDAAVREKTNVLEFKPRALANVLVQRGFDKLLELYRIDDHGGLNAYYDQGVYKYRTGFLESGAEYLTFAIVLTCTTVIEYIIHLDPDYRFTALPSLLRDALKNRVLSDYLEAVDAFGQIYALGTALYETREIPKMQIATDLWRIVSDQDDSGRWSTKARLQLQSPFQDDFMIIFP
jgi:tetratricopeptide (TPR) repeat protein